MKNLLVCALEPSANLHLGEILAHLKDYKLCGIFDEKFGDPYAKSSEFSAMGFVEILPLILKAKKAMRDLCQMAQNCDHILLIDSPAFNLPFAKMLKNADVMAKITYYILPQVWAWRKNRIEKVERYCDNLCAILPFELEFYKKAVFVGHPLLDEIPPLSAENSGCIAFLPGSRKAEIKNLMPIFRNLAKLIKKPKILCVPEFYKDKIAEIYGDVSNFSLESGAPQVLAKSEFAFVCSGTATLEAALVGVPFVLCYKARNLDFLIAKFVVKLKYIGLANIIFDFLGKEKLHDEILQSDLTPENLMNSYKNFDTAKFKNGREILLNYLKNGSAKNVANIINEN